MAKTGLQSLGPGSWLTIDQEPCPCPRPRVGRWGAYYPAKYSKWKKAFSSALRRVVERGEFTKQSGPLEVRICCFATKPKTSKLLHPKPDVDNYAKAVLDAANGILWDDDSQITSLHVLKDWTPAQCPLIQIEITPAPPSSGMKPARAASRKTI